ncbi:MAG: large conductance mechanosensitive channel protein MscL [Actinomycetia bacterium]|nr:large conductance mechanosensitive channel protein MscL [Actinomycetes bacterium]MCP4960632.1 large conductance mechanosensitive channel protein MscL [Actinomycetes bacterium]
MKNLIAEFREFVDKGNIVDAAVGLILALAFKPVVDSLVNDVIMQIVAAIFGQPDFSALSIHWGDPMTGVEGIDEAGRQLYDGGQIFYGSFINTVISFLIIAFIVFMMVRSYNGMKRAKEETAAEEPAGPTEVELLTEIRDSLNK